MRALGYGSKVSDTFFMTPFLLAKEILVSNPKITPDPRGAEGYFRYEGAGLEMIYNPLTGQVGHIQPIRPK